MAIGKKLVWGIIAGTAIWMFMAILAGLTLWPAVPSSWPGWLLLVVFGPPLYILGELVADRFWSTKAARFVSEHPSRCVRITVGVAFGLVLLAVVIVFSHLAGAG